MIDFENIDKIVAAKKRLDELAVFYDALKWNHGDHFVSIEARSIVMNISKDDVLNIIPKEYQEILERLKNHGVSSPVLTTWASTHRNILSDLKSTKD